jgi:hypothetical protein
MLFHLFIDDVTFTVPRKVTFHNPWSPIAKLTYKRLESLTSMSPTRSQHRRFHHLHDQRVPVANFPPLFDTGQSIPQRQQLLAANAGGVQFRVRKDCNLALIDCRRRFAGWCVQTLRLALATPGSGLRSKP